MKEKRRKKSNTKHHPSELMLQPGEFLSKSKLFVLWLCLHKSKGNLTCLKILPETHSIDSSMRLEWELDKK